MPADRSPDRRIGGPVRLGVIAAALPPDLEATTRGDAVVDDVTHDSRNAGPGVAFVAIRGSRVDGHALAADAVAAGAPALVVDHHLDDLDVPQLVVRDTRAALGHVAAVVHGDPSRRLAVVGVTGTNGKTTVTHMVEAIVEASGRTSGVLGTVGGRIAGTPVAVERTTPEASDLQRFLARMVEAGVDVAALEVSSHAMALFRVEGTRFRVGAFTNLSQDHLDFHGDMDRYFEAKARLFTPDRVDAAVIWTGDEWGRRLAATTPVRPLWLVGNDAVPDEDVRDEGVRVLIVTRVVEDLSGARFHLQLDGGDRIEISVPLPGRFNVANAAVAAGIGLELGFAPQHIAAGLASLRPVPGRFERIHGAGIDVVVDYAHTPEAVAAVVAEGRALVSGRVIVVVGAGGDRDRDKRAPMGRAAASGDVVVVTSDNPRSEDPDAIVATVAAGAAGGPADIVTEVDRRRAIRLAIDRARPGDAVLVLGKGHEQGQELAGGRVVPFDDRHEVRAALAMRETGRLREALDGDAEVPARRGGA